MPRNLIPDHTLTEEQGEKIITLAVPEYAYRSGQREWAWTRPSGIWRLNLTIHEPSNSLMKARQDGSPSLLQVCVRLTKREVSAALRFLLLVDAIDHHPDDPHAVDRKLS